MSDLFAHERAGRRARDRKKDEAPKITPHLAAAAPYALNHRCAVCGGFAPFGRGLPHRGESVRYFCREHEPK
ncbi:hypothetical protein [Methylocystis parvus]|uniref:hypothetical protein n=1 Tax=Methylocystis parvus TaxID=134 RepID=UPI003C70AC11